MQRIGFFFPNYDTTINLNYNMLESWKNQHFKRPYKRQRLWRKEHRCIMKH